MGEHWDFVNGMAEIPAGDWDALGAAGTPFLRHAFLLALESSGCVAPATGWRPLHAVLRRGGRLLAAMPLYLKAHSYGEYVFDWQWAEAWQRLGLRYYPKLVSAVPFTPSTGPRLLLAEEGDREVLAASLRAAVCALAQRLGASGWHLLFPRPGEMGEAAGLQARTGCQYHWHDRGYGDFEGFLAACNARHRKSMRRERRRVAEQGVAIRCLAGGQIGAAELALFHRCYRHTYQRLSGHGGYLSREFFQALCASMPGQLVLLVASRNGRDIASALCLRDDHSLYGRYWGALEEVDGLHFELCYYQGIDYCLREGLRHFDPGTQGEHKIARGFEPVETHSLHWLAEPRLRGPVAEFLREEREAVLERMACAAERLPFARGG